MAAPLKLACLILDQAGQESRVVGAALAGVRSTGA